MTPPTISATRWHFPATDQMTRHLLVNAALAGAAAGLIASALQLTFVVPTLLEGELYESGERLHFMVDGTPQSERGAPGLDGDLTRHAMTVAFNIVTYLGYGLILAGAMALAERRGFVATARTGLVWGMSGFIAIQLAPAIGLPPELPGTPATEVGPRQAWWLLTVASSAMGLALIAFTRGLIPFAGVALLLFPHLIGAPHLDTYWGVAPPELAAHFVTLSLGAALVGWTSLGFLCGWFRERRHDSL